MLLPEHGTLISQLDPSWFRLRPFPRARICHETSKALKASLQLGTLDLHLVTSVAVFVVNTEHDAWHVVPTGNRSRRPRAQWCASMSWELWARPPVLTPVPCRRTHSSQRPRHEH